MTMIDLPQDREERRGGLYDSQGRRLSMTVEEMRAFLAAARDAPDSWRTFSRVLAFTGCRPGEAFVLTAAQIDLKQRSISFETLRRKENGSTRVVPVPDFVLVDLARVHALRAAQSAPDHGSSVLLWPWSHVTAWNRIGRLMEIAAVQPGPHASARGLRHGFANLALGSGVPLALVQNWLGHTRIQTTRSCYDRERERSRATRQYGRAKARELASRVWAALTLNAPT